MIFVYLHVVYLHHGTINVTILWILKIAPSGKTKHLRFLIFWFLSVTETSSKLAVIHFKLKWTRPTTCEILGTSSDATEPLLISFLIFATIWDVMKLSFGSQDEVI